MDFLRDRVVLEIVKRLGFHEAATSVDPKAWFVRVSPRLVRISYAGCILDPNDGDFVAVTKVFTKHEIHGLIPSHVEENVCMTIWLQHPGSVHENLVEHVHD